jgi:hypothetical protein
VVVLRQAGRHYLLVFLCMLHLVALVPMHGVLVACCWDCVLAFVVSGVVKLLSSSPFFLETKKKKLLFYFAFSRNNRDIRGFYGTWNLTRDMQVLLCLNLIV